MIMSASKKNPKVNKPVLSSYAHHIWYTFPSTVAWIQRERDKAMLNDDHFVMKTRYRGINATIILLSAATLEGFLRGCLESFTKFSLLDYPEEIIQPTDFSGRLELDYLKRVSGASFGDFPELFHLAIGNLPSELITNKDLVAGAKALILYRNAIAHANPARYVSYNKPKLGCEVEYEISGRYKELDKYFKNHKLKFVGDDVLFQNEVADHFAALVKPYIKEVLSVLPKPQSGAMGHILTAAYQDMK